ncbi:MAG TPA: thioredoxin domain-containing protein [Methanoregulaceae archaeon]|nr:thioredoxin domain-containing protein [Methanoregulaceae archaeon]HRY75648.1 thioredoxin domain-containing protein [Methanoregulaceae archaeon]
MEPDNGTPRSPEGTAGKSPGPSGTGKDDAGVPPPAIATPAKPAATPPSGTTGEERPDVFEATDRTWEGIVEKGKLPVAVMFYSPACAFCRQMEPYFREYAADFRGLVLFVRLDIMVNSWTPERYGVRSTPTFKFFCDGKPVQELVGAVYPAILKRTIADVLAHGKECARNSTAIDYEITGYG